MRDRNAYASLREGLVGAWIPSVSGSGLLLPDLSGNGNNGTLTNMGPEDWVSGKYGRALDFDGANDRIVAGATSTGALTAGTLSFWVFIRTDLARKYHHIYGNNSITGLLVYASTSGGLGQAFQIAIGASSYPKKSTSGINFTGNAWDHGLLTWNSKSVSFYLNGTSIGSASFTNDPVFVSSTLLGGYGNLETLNGKLDDIRIYNRALSESEIKLLASRPGIGLRPQRRTMYYAPPTGAKRRRILTSMP